MQRFPRVLALLATGAVLAAACGGATTPPPATSAASAAASATPKYPTKAVDIMAPAATGGGFDTTARLFARALTEEKIVDVNVTVSNVPGAGGVTGMTQLLKNNKGNSHTLIVVGRVTIGNQAISKSEAKASQLTPIARLMAESEVIVTPKDSPYKSIKDVIDALKKDVNSVKFAGGSAGGIDHELAALLVKAAGGDVKAWKSYVPFAGGGEAAAAIIGGQVQVGISGYGEFKGQIDSGTMKALAVSAEQPLSTAKTIPTLKSQGIDITIVNWRMLAAPPEIPIGDLTQLKAIAKKVHDGKTWQDFAAKNDWFDNFTT
ncbi:MAG TPA: tripartite tricarboxylate transporter substrate-binding protein, partial [Candidatus Limnocylindria bacterium]|nr:tripartite tricarboxylate transporter substrate-binding protein [Candidatus Limnocylindria bacterium]